MQKPNDDDSNDNDKHRSNNGRVAHGSLQDVMRRAGLNPTGPDWTVLKCSVRCTGDVTGVGVGLVLSERVDRLIQ